MKTIKSIIKKMFCKHDYVEVGKKFVHYRDSYEGHRVVHYDECKICKKIRMS